MTAFQQIKSFALLAVLLLLFPVYSTASSAPLVNVLEPIATGVSTPLRLAEDRTGNLYLTDPRSGGVLKFSSSGLHAATFAVARPQGIAITGAGDMIIGQGDSVLVLNSAGQEKFRLGKGAGQFKMANGITVDGAGYIYVVDSIDNCVQVFNSLGAAVNSGNAAAGKPANSFGSSGSADGQFAMPTGIAFEKASGQLAIADTNNGRVQFFTTAGAWQRSIGSMGPGALHFTSPVAVAFEYTNDASAALSRMYVTDSFQSSVQVIDPAASPVWLGYIGSYGRSKGKLLNPADALFDPLGGRLLVANGFGTIAVYGLNGGGTPTVDKIPPALTVDPAPTVTAAATLLLGGTVETGATLAVTTDTAATAGTPLVTGGGVWTVTVAALVAGVNNITITATDNAGNTATRNLAVTYSPGAVNLTIDKVATPTNSTTQTISGTMDAGATIAITLSTAATAGAITYPTATTWRSVISGLVPGENLITVTATKAGSGSAINKAAITLTTTPPSLFVSMLADGSTTSVRLLTVSGHTDATITTVTVNGQTVQCVNGLFSKGIILAGGVNTITVQATDAAGNSTQETRNITYDAAAPLVNIATPTAGKVTNQSTIQVSGTSSAGSSTTIKVNGAIQANLSGTSWTTTVNLVNGISLYTIEAEARDAASSKTAVTAVMISLADLTVPVVDLTTPPGDLVTNSSSLSLSGSATAAAVAATLNGVAVPVSYQAASGGYSLTVSFPAEGVYTLLLTATDAFGGTSNIFRTLIFDLTPPALTVTAQSATAISGSGEADATVVVKDAKGGAVGTAVVQRDGSWSVALTGAELLPLNVYALDTAGNSSRNGNLDGSGRVDIADALKAMRIALKLDPAPGANSPLLLHGDVAPFVNGVSMPDGRIDIDDVMVMLMKSVGLIK
jgi:hypothetical protein